MSDLDGLSRSPPRSASPAKVLCREIRATDAEGVISLLTRGFAAAKDRAFWVRAFTRLSYHPTPPGLPRYGYLLESGDVPVGVILLIFTAIADGDAPRIQCNVSSWYVDPRFRAFATMLISCALKHEHVTYFNLTPAPHTWPILEVQGYKRFALGRFVAIPALSPRQRGYRVEAVTSGARPGDDLPPFELGLLRSHAEYGCLSLICSTIGDRHPFVFALRRRRRVPYALLIYCRSMENFVRFAGNLGRYLVRRGVPLVIVDANAAIPGLFGVYLNDQPKYFRGPDQPRLGNLPYSELAMFGV